MVLHESLKRSGVWGQNSNSIVRHMKKDLDIISTYSHFTIHPCTLATRNSCLQFPEDAVPISCPHNLWCLASPLLRKSSTKTNMKDWFLCDVFLHSLRKWLLPLPYAFLFQTPTQISLAYVYNILQLTVCMFERSGFSLVQFSHPVMSDSLQPHGLQHVRLPSFKYILVCFMNLHGWERCGYRFFTFCFGKLIWKQTVEFWF